MSQFDPFNRYNGQFISFFSQYLYKNARLPRLQARLVSRLTRLQPRLARLAVDD